MSFCEKKHYFFTSLSPRSVFLFLLFVLLRPNVGPAFSFSRENSPQKMECRVGLPLSVLITSTKFNYIYFELIVVSGLLGVGNRGIGADPT